MPFPSSPSNNTTAVVNGITYIYNSSLQAWKIVPGGADFTDTFARTQANSAFAAANTGAIANTFVQVGYPMTMGLVTDAITGGLGEEQFLRTWDNRTTLPTHLIFANNTIQLDAGYLT